MADDYRSARRHKHFDGPKSDTTKKDGPGKDNRRCHICQQEGHVAANCKEKGRHEASWECVEDRKTVGYGI